MKKVIIITISILFLLTASNTQASLLDELPGPEIMPDNPLYFIKIWYEQIITFISFGDIKKAERYSKLAERRLYEAEKMAKKGKEELTKKLLGEYEKNLSKAIERVDKIKKKVGEEVKQGAKERMNQSLEIVSQSTLKSQEVLLRVYELVPDEAKETVREVIRVTKNGYERAVDAVSGIKKEELKQKAEEIKNRTQELIKDGWKIFGE